MARTFRRADRRRRPVRHRRGLSPAAANVRARASPSSKAATHRRHLGPVPLSRHPLRLRHVHARLFVQAVDRGRRRSPTGRDPELCPRDRGRERHRQEDPLQPSGQAGVVVVAPTRAGRSRPNAGSARAAPSRALHLQFPVHVLAAITTTRTATRRSSRARDNFAGQIVHPQKWPEDLDYAGKRVVVIGAAPPR